MEHEMAPRQYAAQILKEPDREKRKALLDDVPGHLQPLVRLHVKIAWKRKGHEVR